MTRDEIVTKASDNLNDAGYFYTPTDFSDSIQDAYDEVISLSMCKPAAVRIDITANKTYYDLPTLISDFVALRGVYNSRNKRWMVPKTSRWFEAQRNDWELQIGEPDYFGVFNFRYCAIYPKLSSTVSNALWVFYYSAANTLIGSDTPNLPAVRGDEALEFYATADLFEQAEEWVKAQEYYEQYLERFREIELYRNTLRLPDYVDGLR